MAEEGQVPGEEGTAEVRFGVDLDHPLGTVEDGERDRQLAILSEPFPLLLRQMREVDQHIGLGDGFELRLEIGVADGRICRELAVELEGGGGGGGFRGGLEHVALVVEPDVVDDEGGPGDRPDGEQCGRDSGHRAGIAEEAAQGRGGPGGGRVQASGPGEAAGRHRGADGAHAGHACALAVGGTSAGTSVSRRA